MSLNEYDLITKLREGNATAFKQLFDGYSTLVYNVSYRMLQNRQDAEDVMQEVFLRAYRSLKHFRAESQLSTWLCRIAVNLSLNHQRRKKRERWLSLDVFSENQEAAALTATSENDLDRTLEKGETERIVQKAINTLPKQQRVALLLHRYEGLSYQEIAEVMNTSVPSVESRLHRAKENLYKRLFSYFKEI